MRAPRDATGGDHEGDLSRDLRPPRRRGLAEPRPRGAHADRRQALAGAASRPLLTPMASGIVHIVGAGLAGLAAAVRLAGAGRKVVLHEASGHAGGRCRSYFDTELGCRIDNGNHLLLSGNHAALDYLERVGALGTLEGPSKAIFPFIDAATGQRWTVEPNRGPVPWWILQENRRVPGSRATDYLAALALR